MAGERLIWVELPVGEWGAERGRVRECGWLLVGISLAVAGLFAV